MHGQGWVGFMLGWSVMTGLTSLTAQVGQSGSLAPRGAIAGPFLWGQAGSATRGAGPMQGRGRRLRAAGNGQRVDLGL